VILDISKKMDGMVNNIRLLNIVLYSLLNLRTLCKSSNKNPITPYPEIVKSNPYTKPFNLANFIEYKENMNIKR
jgi:hypothetical protein